MKYIKNEWPTEARVLALMFRGNLKLKGTIVGFRCHLATYWGEQQVLVKLDGTETFGGDKRYYEPGTLKWRFWHQLRLME